MKASRVLVFSGLLLMVCVVFVACGGSGSKPTPPQPLMITTTTLAQATINNPYMAILQATGGSGTYTWAISSGSLPAGLTFSGQMATISGTPTAGGTFPFTAQVTDGASHTATANLSLTVEGALVVTCNSCTGTSTLPYGSPGMMYGPAMLSATGGTAPYTWCVLETSGTCDNGAGGALPVGLTITTDSNGNGIISGTPTSQPAAPLTITVEVADSETIPAHGSAPLSLTIFSVQPASLPAGVLFAPYHQSVAAAGGAGPYNWTLTGTLPPGLSFGPCVADRNPSCPITGTPTQAGTFPPFTLAVTDGQNPMASASQQFTVTVASAVGNSLLNGNYAFALNGYANGTPFVMAGAFVADGNGNITSGKLDRNDGHGSEYNDPSQCRGNPNCPIPEIMQSGSVYDLTGGAGLGTMTILTLDDGGNPHTYQFSISVSGTACTANVSLSDCGRLILRDPANPNNYGSGVLKVQDTQFFSIDAFFPGNFALLATGIDPSGNRYAAAGAIGTNPTTRVDIDCNANGWGLTDCPLDVNDNGNAASDPFGGSISADLDANTGRGNFVNIGFPNDPNGYCLGGLSNPTCGYAYYIVNKQEMILISGDPLSKPANLTLWSAFRQKSSATGWGTTSLMGPMISELTAADTGGSNSSVTAGIFTADGAGNATFGSDTNDAGTLTQQAPASGTYAIDSQGNKTGRVTLSGFPQFGANGAVLYLYTGNYAYLVGTDAKVTSGVMEQQSGSPFTNASVNGAFAGATAWPAVPAVTNSAAELFADGAGNINVTEYTSGPNGVGGPTSLTLSYQVDSTGRAVVNQSGTEFGILYVVGPKKVVLLPAGNAPALSIFISGQPE